MVEIIQFRNQPILKITKEGSYTKLQIGLKKASLILSNINEIQKFVNKYSQEPKEND